MNRASYERKKKNGRFLAEECIGLCRLFNQPFEYLFQISPAEQNDHTDQSA